MDVCDQILIDFLYFLKCVEEDYEEYEYCGKKYFG